MIQNITTSYFAAAVKGASTSHACSDSFLGFPAWYKYLPQANCSPQLNSLSDVWLIVAAVIEILLRVAAIAAVIFVVYGAFSLVTSQGKSESTAKARDTIINALVGLAIAVLSAAIVAYIASHVS